jgi:hypothetical protein
VIESVLERSRSSIHVEIGFPSKHDLETDEESKMGHFPKTAAHKISLIRLKQAQAPLLWAQDFFRRAAVPVPNGPHSPQWAPMGANGCRRDRRREPESAELGGIGDRLRFGRLPDALRLPCNVRIAASAVGSPCPVQPASGFSHRKAGKRAKSASALQSSNPWPIASTAK